MIHVNEIRALVSVISLDGVEALWRNPSLLLFYIGKVVICNLCMTTENENLFFSNFNYLKITVEKGL